MQNTSIISGRGTGYKAKRERNREGNGEVENNPYLYLINLGHLIDHIMQQNRPFSPFLGRGFVFVNSLHWVISIDPDSIQE